MYELRYYQKQSSEKALSSDNGIVVLPTGSGKSLVIADIVNNSKSKVLIFQPNKEILEQNYKKITEFGFSDAKIYSASLNQKELGRATFATIGSVANKKDLFRDYKTIIIDECHLVNAKGGQYLDFIQSINPDKLIGLTATPYRLHTNSFGSTIKMLTRTRPKVFKDIIHVTQTSELLNSGYLANPIFQTDEDAEQARSILRVNSTGANFTESSVDKFLQLVDANSKTIASVQEAKSEYYHILVFAEAIKDSQKIAELLNKLGTVTSTVDSTTKKKDREKILSDFKSGKVKVIINVGVLTTGFDFPALDCLIIARPTMSLSLWYQMVGRCVRPFKNKKPKIYDFGGNYSYFGNPLEFEIKQSRNSLYDVFSGAKQLTTVTMATKDDNFSTKNNSNYTMPFGKYRGKSVSGLPSSYLAWCSDNISASNVVEAINVEIDRRKKSYE